MYSPCVDAGTSEEAPYVDIKGETRPHAGEVDREVYENCPMDLDGESRRDPIFFPLEWCKDVVGRNRAFDFINPDFGPARIDNRNLVERLDRYRYGDRDSNGPSKGGPSLLRTPFSGTEVDSADT